MLSGHKLRFYFDKYKGKRVNFDKLIDGIRNRFITKEHIRALIREWDGITLASIMEKSVSKKLTDCLKLLVRRLQNIQAGLKNEYKNEAILQNKLLKTVKDIDACKLAYFKSTDSLSSIISDLQPSLAAT